MAYSIVHSIRYPLKAYGVHSDWSNIVRTMNIQKVITMTMKTKVGNTLRLKKCSEPEAYVREIYRMLKYKKRPFCQKNPYYLKMRIKKIKTLNHGKLYALSCKLG